MSVSYGPGDVPEERKRVIAVFNVDKQEAVFTHDTLKGADLRLHPVLEKSAGKQAGFDRETGTVRVPPRTTVVYYEPESDD
jgi:hypothetical protein